MLVHGGMFKVATTHPRLASLSHGPPCVLFPAGAAQPDALFLDEPTNHLDPWSIQWLEEYLAK